MMAPLSFLVAASLLAGPALAGSDPVTALRWKARALVVFAPSPADPGFAAQRRDFEAAAGANRDRDLVLIEALGNSPASRSLRERFDVPAGVFRAVLVGKDGGAKLVSPTPIGAALLHGTIDAMPMRQDEIRQTRS